MTTTQLGTHTMAVVRANLQGFLAEDVVDELLDKIAEDLDAAGITAITTEQLEHLRRHHHVYRSALQQLGHAIEAALEDVDDGGGT